MLPMAPGPVTTFNTPGGRPASAQISANSRALSLVYVAGFSTTVFPIASAGQTFHINSISGKFQGTIAPTTPVQQKRLQYDHLNKYKNKLWCESTTNPVPVLHIAASHGFSELTKNVVRSSHGHSAPSLKISFKLVRPFSHNLANKETKKKRKKDTYIHTNKEIDRKQYPVPRCIGDG